MMSLLCHVNIIMSKTANHFLHTVLKSPIIRGICLNRLDKLKYFHLSSLSYINDHGEAYAGAKDHCSDTPSRSEKIYSDPAEMSHNKAESGYIQPINVDRRMSYFSESNIHATEHYKDCDNKFLHQDFETVPWCSYFSKRFYSSGGKSLFDDLLKTVQQKEMSIELNRKSVPSNFSLKSQQVSNPIKSLKKFFPHFFSEDGELLPTTTIEKQLMGLMQMWEMEEAVELLRESVTNHVAPDRQVILDLLQQLANLGEVSCLLEVHEFLKDRGLTTNLRFYHCLRDAYFNSGRIEEGFAMLRIVYHGTRDFEDTDMLFTLLATMTLKHFVHRMSLIEDFVKDLEESEPPVLTARASLWRCLVLAEQFDQASSLLEEHPNVTKMVPEQVTKLIHSPLKMNYNHDAVLTWLIDLPLIKPGLKASVFDKLIKHKSDEGEWVQGLEYLSSAMEQDMKIHPHTVQLFLTMFLSQLSDAQVRQLSDWAESLDGFSEDNGDKNI